LEAREEVLEQMEAGRPLEPEFQDPIPDEYGVQAFFIPSRRRDPFPTDPEASLTGLHDLPAPTVHDLLGRPQGAKQVRVPRRSRFRKGESPGQGRKQFLSGRHLLENSERENARKGGASGSDGAI
jgi:hypothetical protein